ncbi:MAG: RecQ family ATP-dependent DNA helicase [Actinobacteria bacterium]|nr:RecQ family ATP-dependent DNA helicase [Actinomycetota bacterium]
MSDPAVGLFGEALDLLRRAVGPNAQFRPHQFEAIQAVVQNRRRVLLVQRTGWGKSAVYFIATRLLRRRGGGPTVIVSPLIALMRNQVEMADRLGVNSRTVNSTNREEWEPVFDAIRGGMVDLLLISPERLNNPEFRSEVLPDLLRNLGLLVVDEVHCISDWGHDFRPDYRRLSRIVESLPPNLPVVGTTATANDRVVEDVAEQLGGDLLEIRGPLDRESLALQVVRLPGRAERMAWLAATVPTLPGCGIVYCLTIRDVERVGAWLRERGVDAATYTGESDNSDRLDIEGRLSRGSLKVVVATSALGMGYDNPFIHFVVHFQSPGSPIAYYQQVGRAGRAVDRAHGVLLAGAEDAEIQDYFIRTAFPAPEAVEAVLTALARADGLTRIQLEQVVNLPRGRIEGMLKVLEVEGALYREGRRWYRSAQRWEYPQARVAAVTEQRRREQQAMVDYTATTGCLFRFLRRQLDDPEAEPCGRCANCAGPALPEAVDGPLLQAVLAFLRLLHLRIEPRRQWPSGFVGPSLREFRVGEGRALARWGDPGVAELVRLGKYRDGRFHDDLIEAVAAMIEQWRPDPEPAWLTYVPAFGGGGVVADLAPRLAGRLGLPCLEAVTKTRSTPKQKTMQNSYQQVVNLQGAFAIGELRPGPVLLLDDMVDSRWTFTMVGSLLREAGCGPVYPVALADTSRGDQ